MHHPASNPAHDSEKNQRDLDFSSFETILGLMKNLSRNNLESLIEVGFEQIHEEDRLAIEAGKPPKRDSLYEIAKDLARQVKRRVSENDVLPEGWSLLDEYAVWFDEDLDELNGDGDSEDSDSSSYEGGEFKVVDPKDLCPGCGAISGEDDGKLCFGCEFEKDTADPHASASSVLGSENYHRSSAVDFRSERVSVCPNAITGWGEPGSPPHTEVLEKIVPWVQLSGRDDFVSFNIVSFQKDEGYSISRKSLSTPCFLCGKIILRGERCEECHRDAAELESVRQHLEKLDPKQ